MRHRAQPQQQREMLRPKLSMGQLAALALLRSRRHAALVLLAIAGLLLNAGTATAASDVDAAIGKARTDIALGAFLAPGGFDLRGEARWRYRLHPLVDLAVAGRAGMLRSTASTGSSNDLDQLVLSLGIGPVLHTQPARDAWEFAAGLLVAHVHHARLSSWQRTPLANLAGDSSGSVRHRSGLEAFAAATAPPIAQLGSYVLLAGAEVGASWLPSSADLRTAWGARLTLGVRWQPPVSSTAPVSLPAAQPPQPAQPSEPAG